MRRLSKTKKWFFACVTLCLSMAGCLLVAELICTAYYPLTGGYYLSVAEMLAKERNTFIRGIAGEECSYVDTLYPHPYLGFVHHSRGPCGLESVNNVGLFGHDFPLEKKPHVFTLLVTGGSVASQLCGNVSDNYLEDYLNTHYHPPQGERFVVLNGADGAWKQPQQSIMLLLYGHIADAVITLDGYNEFTHFSGPHDLQLEYPASNFLTINPLSQHSYRELMRIWLGSRMHSIMAGNPLLSKSHLAYFVYQRLRRVLQNDSAFNKKEKPEIVSFFQYPENIPAEGRIAYAIEKYRRYFRLMQQMAAVNNTPCVHYIQPVPAIGKQLTEDEKQVVGDLELLNGYRDMTSALITLNRENIPVISLLDIFKDVTESVYADTIHCIQEKSGSRGYEIMAAAVAVDLAKRWPLTRRIK